MSERKTFGSTLGIVVSCLGCVVGTGNIWRFPRILAMNSDSQGCLSFLIGWAVFLLMWSMPMILVEYGLGRFAKGGPVMSFRRFVGPRAGWCGLWVTGLTFLILCYYIVIQGWCFYYIYYSAAHSLPKTSEDGLAVFNDFSQSYWPICTQGIGILLAALLTIGGITKIEKANMLFIPILLSILIFTFVWSLCQNYSDLAIRFLFSPNWKTMLNPSMWIQSAAQNAFDTSACLGVFLTYASYMTSHDSVVKFSVFIPLGNNLISLLCGITVFATAFTSLIERDPFLSQAGLIDILQTSGPGSTGLTFVWMPVLFGQEGVLGRVLCVLFYFCLSFAAISSTISMFEMAIVTLKELGIPNRKLSIVLVSIVSFGLGFGSAWSPEILNNQDFVWGFGILVSGLFLQFAVIYYGVLRFRSTVINQYSKSDWSLPYAWAIIIQFIAPLEATGLIVWWLVDLIRTDKTWYIPSTLSVMTVIIEWTVLLSIALFVNFVLFKCRVSWEDNFALNEMESTSPAPQRDVPAVSNEIYNCWDNLTYVDSNLDIQRIPRIASVRSDFSEDRTVL